LDKRFKKVEIKRIGPNFAKSLSSALLKSGINYSKYFIPFEFDYESIKQVLLKMKLDQFFCIFVNNKIAGFYMLRGFDDGYKIPTYGVWISKDCSGMGLAKLTIRHAISFCKINGVDEIMLKVHPENIIAKKIYEKSGFVKKGIDPKNNHLIYKKKI